MQEPLTQTPYQRLGGAEVLHELVERFYGYMDTLPEAAPIRAMHAEDLSGAKSKLFKFLSGWLGGPDLFMQEFGHPRLRARHFPFSIGVSERDQWLLCMRKALDDIPLDGPFREALYEALARTAHHMINRED
ncbi:MULTISPECIES: group II truncated hemoglobin [Methylococcus]|uniref:Group II truncated hemoglobin n=1 Tax=Methylococcus capsulatus TaxID=414 RepID=A0ABZ2F1Y8_METCP|nr:MULTISPECIES: group II truncated hemoglobin [Methylococcus]MDF9391895.1 globin [Methylococcus capsulatus]